MVVHGGSSAGSYLANPTSSIPSHCASIIATSTSRVNIFWPILIWEHLFKHCMPNILRMLLHMFVVYSTHILSVKVTEKCQQLLYSTTTNLTLTSCSYAPHQMENLQLIAWCVTFIAEIVLFTNKLNEVKLFITLSPSQLRPSPTLLHRATWLSAWLLNL